MTAPVRLPDVQAQFDAVLSRQDDIQQVNIKRSPDAQMLPQGCAGGKSGCGQFCVRMQTGILPEERLRLCKLRAFIIANGNIDYDGGLLS